MMADNFSKRFNGGALFGAGAAADPARRAEAVRVLLAASAVTILLYCIPFASFLTYPLRLLVTFLHEGGHAVATMITGGAVSSISIFPDGSGVTWSRGGARFLVASSGYLGAMLYGAALIASLRRGIPGRSLLLVTGAMIGLLTLGFVRPWANPFGFVWGVAITAALVAGGLRLPERTAGWIGAFVGVQCVMNALFDLRTLLNLSTMPGAPRTDAATLAAMTWIPAPVWAVLWIAASLAMLWVVLRPARSGRASAI